MKTILFTLILVSFSAHASTALKRINTHMTVIKTYAAFDLSCVSDSDCVAIASGQRSCGGPSTFVVTSKNNSFLNEVKRSAGLHTKEERAHNRHNGSVSICAILSAPTPVCEAQVCQ